LKKKERKRRFRGISSGVYCSLIYLFMFLPIITIVFNSFNANTTRPYLSFKGFSLIWYERLWSNVSLLESFRNTMIIASSSTLIAVIVGTLAAVGMYRYKFRGKSLIDGMLYIPVVIPEIILGIALLSLFARLGVPRGYVSLILAHASFSIPFVVFNIRARLSQYDSSIEEASMDLGAGRFRTFMNITLPVLFPGIAGGALLAFTLSIDDVIISYFTNGKVKTLPLRIMEYVRTGVPPDVNALSALILLGTIAVVVLSQIKKLKKKDE
jgi:spermidine/putrescine transport system permease protein